MKYYRITDINADVRVNRVECRLDAEHMGWDESSTLQAAEKTVEEVEKILSHLTLLSKTKDEEGVLSKILRVLRDEYGIDTDLIEIELATYCKPFTSEWLDDLDEDGMLQTENQCDHCGIWVEGSIHIEDYFAGKKPTCPICGKPYTPCNECMWDDDYDCGHCPFTKKKGDNDIH